jgi:predicted small metal-binding protein
MEALEVKKYYQWRSGQRSGRVEVYMAEDDNNIWFESSRFVAKDLFETQLMEVDESTYLSKVGTQDLPPPPPMVPQSIEEWESMLGNPIQNSIEPPTPVYQKEKSPIQIILEKQKKLSKETLDVSLDLEFPSSKVFEFMTMMFDEDEVVDEMAEFVYAQLSNDEIHDSIKNSIKNRIMSLTSNQDE